MVNSWASAPARAPRDSSAIVPGAFCAFVTAAAAVAFAVAAVDDRYRSRTTVYQ